jgi:hypothetical protein
MYASVRMSCRDRLLTLFTALAVGGEVAAMKVLHDGRTTEE